MSIEATIEGFIRDEILFEDTSISLDPNRNLIDDGILDSLALLRLIVFVEERFGIPIKDDDLDASNFQTINRIKNFVGEHQS